MRDELEPIYEALKAKLADNDAAGAAALTAELPPVDIADLFRSLDPQDRVAILRLFPAELAAAVLAEVDDRSLPDLLEMLKDDEIVGLLDTLPSDDAADLVGHIEEERGERVVALLEQVDEQGAVELSELLRYPEDSAGGLMAKEFLSMREDQRLGAVVVALRKLEDKELLSLHYCYVVDAHGALVGHVSLLKLLLSDPQLRARDIMHADTLRAGVMDDQEDVANLIHKHDLLSLPIVDADGKLVGRVTVDDAMDVLVEEATEDATRLAGVETDDVVGETSIFRLGRARLPWLFLGLFGQLIGALVLSRFEESLRNKVILTFFIPLVMATGGNTGIQSSTIMIRLLVMDEFDTYRAGRHLAREILVGLSMGVLIGGVMLAILSAWSEAGIGVVVGLTLTCVVVIAATVGTAVPLLLHRLAIDPTVATGPFITTLNDILGLSVYLGLSHWLLMRV